MNTREWSLRESLITEVGFESLFTAKFSNPTKMAVNQKSVCCPTWACVTLLVLCSRPSKQKETKKTKAKSTKIVWTKGNWYWMFLTLCVVSCRPLEITDSVAALLLSPRRSLAVFVTTIIKKWFGLECNSWLGNRSHYHICIQSRNLSSALLQTPIYTQMRRQQHRRKIPHVCCSRPSARSKVATPHFSSLPRGVVSHTYSMHRLVHNVYWLYRQHDTDAIHPILRVFFFISEMVSAKLSRRAGGQLFPRWNGGEGLGNRLRLSVYRLNAVD